MNKPLVSIIIPIYNAECNLEECIASVLALKEDCWELILVNDGSKDSSADICRRYLQQDSRVIYIEQKNSGVSVARNKGIEAASGEWLTFLDADDMLSPDAFSVLKMVKQNDEMIVLQNTKNHRAYIYSDSCKRISGVELQKSILNLCQFKLEHPEVTAIDDFNRWSSCSRFYKNSLVRKFGVRYPKGVKLGEDLIFCLRFAEKIQTVLTNNSVVYYYRDNDLSVTQKFHTDRIENTIRMIEKVEQCIKKDELRKYMNAFSIDRVTKCCLDYYTDDRSGLSDKQAAEKLKVLCQIPAISKAISECGYFHLALGKKNQFFDGCTLWFLKRKWYMGLIVILKVLRKYR